MFDVLIKGAVIVTMDEAMKVYTHGNIGIRDGRISLVSDSLPENSKACRIINGRNKLVMPGLVNCHSHLGMTALRGYADDMPLWEWLTTKIWPEEEKLTGEDVYWISMLGIMEMIKSGTTAFSDMYFFMEQTALAVEHTGIRAVLARGLQGDQKEPDFRLMENRELYINRHGSCNGRIKVFAGPHAVYTCSEDYLKLVIDMVNETGMGIHIHLSETKKEVEDCISQHGTTPTAYLNDMNFFDNHVVAAHCVHLTEGDMEILKNKNVNAVNNPASNCKLGSGFAPVPQMLDMGINVALGTDSAASNNNLNMFEEMHLAALISKGYTGDTTCAGAEDVLRMATVNGAKALGWDSEIGVLEVGKKADLIMLDMDKVHFHPLHNYISSLVYSAQGSDVHTVIIDGRIIMENRIFKDIDEEMVMNKIKR